MTDTRFSTLFDSTVDLLSGVHIDDVGDIETLLMFLFDRPMGVAEGWDDDDAALDVIVHGNDRSHGFTYPFPMSVIELARSCAETVDELGPLIVNPIAPEESPDVSTMSDAELVTSLQQALGQVRLFNMMEAND